jgi:hypothetical protein
MSEVAGALYRVGTVDIVNGNATITGVGTNWFTAIIKVATGDLFTLDFKNWYEVLTIGSDTGIILDRGIEEATASDLNYAILRNTSGTTSTRLAGQIAAQFNQKQLLLDQWQLWTNSTNDTETITDSYNVDREVLTLNSFEVRAEAAILSAESASSVFDQLDSDVTALSNTVASIQGDLDADKAASAASALSASNSASSANDDAIATAADRVQTGLDRTATSNDAIATAADKVATNADAIATAADVVTTNADVVSTNADAAQTALDRIATGNDKTATNADAVQTALDRVATGNDKTDTLAAKNIALANANFKGEWSSLSGTHNIPLSVKDGGIVYMSLIDHADITLSQPSVDTSNWFVLGVIGSTAPDADKLGGELPVYYATAASVTALSNSIDEVDNTSDADKPISSATQSALNLKANASAISNIDNTSDANKPISDAAQAKFIELELLALGQR